MFKRLRTSLSTWIPGVGSGADEIEFDGEPSETDPYRRFGNKSIGVWSGDLGMFTLLRTRGKQLRSMGVSVDGSVALFGEEALYLAERGLLVVLPSAAAGGEPLTTREVYALAVADAPSSSAPREAAPSSRRAACPLHCYWVYAHLRSLGYASFRHRAQAAADGSAAAAPAVWSHGPDGDGDDVPLAFEVHQPSAQFSKRNLGPPAFVVFVALYGGALPPVHRVAGLIAAAAPTAVKAAVVAGDGTVLLFDLKAGVPAVN